MRKLTGRTGFLLGAGENLRLLVWSWRKFETLGQELRENILSCLSKSLWYSFSDPQIRSRPWSYTRYQWSTVRCCHTSQSLWQCLRSRHRPGKSHFRYWPVLRSICRFFVGCDRTFRCVMKYISGHMQWSVWSTVKITSQALTGIKFSIVCAKQIGGNFFIGQASVCIMVKTLFL